MSPYNKYPADSVQMDLEKPNDPPHSYLPIVTENNGNNISNLAEKTEKHQEKFEKHDEILMLEN